MIKTFLVDDHAAALRGLKADLDKIFPKIEVVGEAQDKKTAIQKIKNLDIDLLITDLRFKHELGNDLDGLVIIDEVKKIKKKIKILVVTYDDETEWYDIVVNQKNAHGILSKNYSLSDLSAAVESLMLRQQIYRSAAIVELLAQRQNVRSDSQEFYITEKARNMIALLSEGKTRDEIANVLNYSRANVDKILGHLFRQLNVSNSNQLIREKKKKNII